MLGGLLVGGLLLGLFMGHGFRHWTINLVDSWCGSIFYCEFFEENATGNANNQSSAFNQNAFSNFTNPFANSSSGSSNTSSNEYPAGFDPEAFLREAKVTYIRLQAAYDQKNLQDLTTFTAPECSVKLRCNLMNAAMHLIKQKLLP